MSKVYGCQEFRRGALPAEQYRRPARPASTTAMVYGGRSDGYATAPRTVTISVAVDTREPT